MLLHPRFQSGDEEQCQPESTAGAALHTDVKVPGDSTQVKGRLHKESSKPDVPLLLHAGPKVLTNLARLFDVCFPQALETAAVGVPNRHRPVTGVSGLETWRLGPAPPGATSPLRP